MKFPLKDKTQQYKYGFFYLVATYLEFLFVVTTFLAKCKMSPAHGPSSRRVITLELWDPGGLASHRLWQPPTRELTFFPLP